MLTCRGRRIVIPRSAGIPRHHDLDFEHHLDCVDQHYHDDDTADPDDDAPGTA
jgi:hypothetical protein